MNGIPTDDKTPLHPATASAMDRVSHPSQPAKNQVPDNYGSYQRTGLYATSPLVAARIRGQPEFLSCHVMVSSRITEQVL
jgi:hypothetical protein